MSKERLIYAAIAVSTAIGLVVGWRTFWFLCDDAYIAFRYVSNAQFGYGYVWNPPPFAPVEGYTSFLWVVILDRVWSWFGVEPPDSANRISFVFSALAMVVAFAMGLRMRLSERLEPWRPAIVGLAMFAIVSNRTWLAWTSSGLETAMDTFLLLLWTYVCVFVRPSRGQAVALALSASILALCRPDGLLFTGITGLLVLWRIRRHGAAEAVALLPFGIVLGHLLWRYSFYGYWLPNTYYAKHVGPWPVAGSIYLASFLLEYFYWIWALLAMKWLSRVDWRVPSTSGMPAGSPERTNNALSPLGAGPEGPTRVQSQGRTLLESDDRLFPAAGVLAVVLHWAYYTFNVGGDHFEYRVYHHLVPLVVLSFPWLADRLEWPARRTIVSFSAAIALGLVIPWIHWARTSWELDVPPEHRHLSYDVAQDLPLPVRWYGWGFDRCQDFLIGHFVGLRWNSHAYYAKFKQAPVFPTREEGLLIDGSDHPVLIQAGVGIPAWTLPHVIILDKLGLNDLVGARTKAAHTGQFERKMAHDRYAPKGYLQCFRPNVRVGKGTATVKPRKEPLTDEDIVQCETEWLAKVTAGWRPGPPKAKASTSGTKR